MQEKKMKIKIDHLPNKLLVIKLNDFDLIFRLRLQLVWYNENVSLNFNWSKTYFNRSTCSNDEHEEMK